MPFFKFKAKNEKFYSINVKIYDEELEVPIEHSSKGSRLFESICASIGLRETWYFGITYESKKYNGTLKWLKMSKKLKDLTLVKYSDNTIKMLLLIKFYPEDVTTELIQEYTQHLYYLQARQQIINEVIYCPAELCILLASYAAQAKFGDLNENERTNGALISEMPKSIVNKFQISESLWEEKIKSCWSSHAGLVKEEAEMEYLKLASTLEMYGISYFEIKNKKGTQVWLGIDAFGLKIYPKEQKISPEIAFKWNEIIDIVINSNKFSIKVNEASKSKTNATLNNKNKKISTFTFHVVDYRVNSKLILEYCIGYHELYMRRRKPESIDIQQMKHQAIELKQRRQNEKLKLEKEKQLRVEAEKKRDELEMRLVEFENQIKQSQEALLKAEEAASLLNERVRLAEEETKLLCMKSSKLEAKMNLYKLLAEKKDQEKRYFEIKTAESELILNHILDKQRSTRSLNASDFDLRTKSNTNLSVDDSLETLLNDDKVIQFSALSMADSLNHLENENTIKIIRDKLLSLKEDLKEVRDNTKTTLNDSIYEKKFEQGDTKYSTLNKIRSGSPNSRVNDFNRL